MSNVHVGRPCYSPFLSVVILIKRKDDISLKSIDCHAFNIATFKQCDPMHHVDEVLDAIGNSKIFSRIGLKRK